MPGARACLIGRFAAHLSLSMIIVYLFRLAEDRARARARALGKPVAGLRLDGGRFHKITSNDEKKKKKNVRVRRERYVKKKYI